MTITERLPFCAALPIVLLATACSSGSDTTPPTQLAAKVNKGEISIHQVNHVLQGQPISADLMPRVRKEVVDRLVEQEVIVQAALTDKIDRDPEVLQRLEAARREVLARSYVEKLSNKVQRPDPLEIESFFKERTELFANRKFFKMNEIVISRRPPNWPELLKELEAAKSLNHATEILRRNKIELPVNTNVQRPSEVLPLELLPAFNKLSVGEVVIYPSAQQVIIAEVMEIRDAPVTQAQATPVIEQFIMNKRKADFVRAEMKRMKDGATVALLGEFAASGLAPADSGAKSDTPAVAPEKDPVQKDKGATDADAITKGLQGALK